MTYRDVKTSFRGQSSELDLPSAEPIAVGAAAICADQQLLRAGIGVVADLGVPAADRLDGERCGVVIVADRHPAGIRGDVVNPVGVCFAQFRVDKVVHVHPDRITGPDATVG